MAWVLHQGPTYRFPKPLINSSFGGFSPSLLLFPMASFLNLTITINCRMFDWSPIDCSLKTNYISFTDELETKAWLKFPKLQFCFTTSALGFPNLLWLPYYWLNLSRSPPWLFATSTLGSLLHFDCRTLNHMSAKVWHSTTSHQNLGLQLSNQWPKVKGWSPFFLDNISCLQFPKS